MSKLKLALGAAGLFLFIVGIKRSFRMDGGEDVKASEPGERSEGEGVEMEAEAAVGATSQVEGGGS